MALAPKKLEDGGIFDRESSEGGPGSGPRPGSQKDWIGKLKDKKGPDEYTFGKRKEASKSQVFVSPKDQGSRKEGYTDARYAGIKGNESRASEVIHKTGKGFQVKSEHGKNLSAPNLSKGAAKKRLAQVEYFKHHKESRQPDDDPNAEAHNMMGDFLNNQSNRRPSRPGWSNPLVYSPPPIRFQQPKVIVKEF